jgi:beta-glucosidase
VNPSGHLPYTIAKQESDYSFADITNSTALLNTTDPNAWQSDFKERLLIDYRHFDYHNLSVQYEFGFGLSYTTFELSDVSITASSSAVAAKCPQAGTSIPPPGGNPALWQTLYTVSAVVTNTGSTTGSAVPQLYLGLPSPASGDVTPVKVLRGFEKVPLQPGESKTVTFPLMRRDLSYWSVETQGWVIGDDEAKVYAGFSSRDIRSESGFKVLLG